MGTRNSRDESMIIYTSGGKGLVIGNQGTLQDNGTETVTISNVAPAAVGTATISKWLPVIDASGTVYYIPMWT